MKLKSTCEARHCAAYLDQFSVRHANISGIGPVKTATLISFGIETAADVNQSSVLRVPGFGNVMTDWLMDWRRRHESRFRYNHTPNAQDIAEEKALRVKFASQKAKLEAIIRNGLNTLQTAKPRLEMLSTKARRDRVLKQAIEERTNSEQDL
jgi:DNA-binding helix-hairpin-helix protein with protein kinase domain